MEKPIFVRKKQGEDIYSEECKMRREKNRGYPYERLSRLVHDEVMSYYERNPKLGLVCDRFGMSRGHMNELLNFDRPFSGLTLASFDKMFPDAVVYLYGEKQGTSVNGNGNSVVQHSTIGGVSDVERFKSGILSDIILSDIPADVKDKVLRIIAKRW